MDTIHNLFVLFCSLAGIYLFVELVIAINLPDPNEDTKTGYTKCTPDRLIPEAWEGVINSLEEDAKAIRNSAPFSNDRIQMKV